MVYLQKTFFILFFFYQKNFITFITRFFVITNFLIRSITVYVCFLVCLTLSTYICTHPRWSTLFPPQRNRSSDEYTASFLDWNSELISELLNKHVKTYLEKPSHTYVWVCRVLIISMRREISKRGNLMCSYASIWNIITSVV